jgi:UDP:flavonoid glycosyltransferase YjiC (YdhE family)
MPATNNQQPSTNNQQPITNNHKPTTKNILVAPLNWGLGHATRCVPIINALILEGFNPILASDGLSLELLKKEFPKLKAVELPSYQIEYPKKGKNFNWMMFKNSPKMLKAIIGEKKVVKKLIAELNLCGIISDNRLGARSKKVPSIFVTHQLNVISGNLSWITNQLHWNSISKFNECWVPDFKNKPNLTGKLGHLKKSDFPIRYLGALSRFKKTDAPIVYDLMVLLSGPEPQRSMLEEKLKIEVGKFKGKVIFIKGVVRGEQHSETIGNITFYNYMTSETLEIALNQSEIVLCRSGYTTIMDLAKLEKKAFFIPTPGQGEQEYLARKLKEAGLVPFAAQDDFKIKNLEEVNFYTGLSMPDNNNNWKKLFSLFE